MASPVPDWPAEPTSERRSPEQGIDIMRALFGRKKLVVFFTAVGCALGYLQFTKQTPTFSSRAEVLVDRETRVKIEGVEDRPEADPLERHVYMMRQPIIIDAAVKRRELAKLSSLSRAADAPQAIAARLGVRQMPDTKGIIALTYTCNDRNDCQKILEAVIESYEAWLKDVQSKNSNELLELIEQARDSIFQDVRNVEQRISEFRGRSKLFFEDQSARILFESRASSIETQRQEVQNQLRQAKAKLEHVERAIAQGATREVILMYLDIEEKPEAPAAPVVPDAPAADPYARELADLEMRRQVLLNDFAANHPSVKSLDLKISVLKERAAAFAPAPQDPIVAPEAPKIDLLAVYPEALKLEVEGLEQDLARLDIAFVEAETNARQLESERQEFQSLIDEKGRLNALFEGVMEKLKASEINKDTGALVATLTMPPGPGAQNGPNMERYLAMGGAGGLVLALALSFLLELADKGFRSPEEITQQLGLPVIGHIPSLDSSRDWKVVKNKIVDRTVATHHRPKSRMAESYRAVRAALFFGARGQSHRVLQVTSPDPGDGKSTLSANLAVAIATSGKRVVLIDADLRRPRQHRVFGVGTDVGLSSVVRDGAAIAESVQATEIEGLDLMTCGPRVDNPAELILSPRFFSMLEEMREAYDFVLVDTPPLLAVTDPSAVAAHVDGVILVVKITKKAKPHALRAREVLDLIGARILGVVVNGVDDEGYAGRSYSYAYSGRYRYTGASGGYDGSYGDDYFQRGKAQGGAKGVPTTPR